MPKGEHQDENKRAKIEAFFVGVRDTGTIAEGCRRAGMSRTTIQRWRAEDEEFEQVIQDSLQDFRESLIAEATRRGRDGFQEPVIYQGELCLRRNWDGTVMLDDDFNPIPLTITKHSDKLLELQLKAHDPRYRDKASVELTGAGGGPIDQTITIEFVRPGDKTGPEPSSSNEDGQEPD